MRLYCLQHEPHEGPGTIGAWCRARGHELDVRAVFSGVELPETGEGDALLVMGGGMGANDERRYPWLLGEKRFIEKCLRERLKVVGVCLGAQLIASIAGASVYPNRAREIGWFPVTLTPAGRRSPLFASCPSSFAVFHWHADTFDLPAGAALLASSAATAHQAFVLDDRVLGLQFHLEIDGELVERFIATGKRELEKSEFVQTPDEIRGGYGSLADLNRRMAALLDSFFQ
jgi:GMP synthase-like glutamine amidotransferase